MMKYQILLIICIFQVYSLTCGGNCPTNSCPYCSCGNTTSYIDINKYCEMMIANTNASINCCKCVIGQSSRGNEKYGELDGGLIRIGVIPFPQQLFQFGRCPQIEGDLCNWKQNAACVNFIYKQYDQWYIWKDQATACGCPYSLPHENLMIQEQ